VSANSAIEWTDATWNPVTGCTKVSAGCDHCYAETFAERWRGTPGHYFEHGFDVQLRPDKLGLPLRWRKPRKVFVNSMSDLFHDQVPDEYIAEVFAVMARTPQHTYQVLTKRHARMRSLLSSPEFKGRVATTYGRAHEDADAANDWLYYAGWPLPNVWLGVSVEDQQWADIRIPALMQTPAAVRFLSCEPLLGPIDLDVWTCPCNRRRWVDDQNWSPEYPKEWRGERSPGDGRIPCGFCNHGGWDEEDIDRPGIGWVIAGGESGRGARPMSPDWARSLRDQCQAADVPFLFKQWGGHTPKTGGRELDGRTWDQYPDGAA
jgi:protein gp37